MKRAFRNSAIWIAALTIPLCGVQGEEKVFDFGVQREGERPAGWRSATAGEGGVGEWRIKEVARERTGQGSVAVREAVVAQLSRNPADERFPMLVYEGESFGDFTATVQARAVAGAVEQMAGLAFRLMDEDNYYVLRLSALGDTVRFYKVVEGIRSPPIGVTGPIESGVWYELKVACQGNQIRCWLDGQELFPALSDNSFTEGRIALWTKSDSVSYFKDLRLDYTPRAIMAQELVDDCLAKYGRLLGLELYASEPGADTVKVVAGSDPAAVGKVGGKVEFDVARQGTVYYGKERGSVSVVMPVRDRNGDPVAAVRLKMKSFAGQTQNNALARARPIVARMSAQVRSGEDLLR